MYIGAIQIDITFTFTSPNLAVSDMTYIVSSGTLNSSIPITESGGDDQIGHLHDP